MRYLVKAKVKEGREGALLKAIEDGTLGKGSIARDEYARNMEEARVDDRGAIQWVEVCFCPTPLLEERPYWEQYVDLIDVKDAHARKKCRDLNGTEPWACCNCNCTQRLEQKLKSQGQSFLETLRSQNLESSRSSD